MHSHTRRAAVGAAAAISLLAMCAAQQLAAAEQSAAEAWPEAAEQLIALEVFQEPALARAVLGNFSAVSCLAVSAQASAALC